MTAEKGEHERAPPVWVSWPASLRATLRAPPSKWAIGAFFPESPCRMLSLVLSFASKESTIPRRGGSPIVRAAVGASDPTGRRPAPADAPKGFPRGKQSARAALPCAPIAICLHPSGSFPKRNELPSKRPALPSHEGGSSPFSHQNRAALLFGKRPMFIFVCQSFSASRSTFASAAATHSSTAALYASSCLVLSRDS